MHDGQFPSHALPGRKVLDSVSSHRDLHYCRRFTDKPIRRAGAFETSYFASSDTFDDNGVWLGAPNAALTGTHDGQPYVVIVTLYNPTYDNQTHTLQYQVRACTLGLNTGSLLVAKSPQQHAYRHMHIGLHMRSE